MTSTKERQQRAAARARLAREMAERQETARRRRQRNAAIGAAAALVLIVGGVAWGISALGSDGEPGASPSPTAQAAAGLCAWQPEDTAANPYLVDVGTPPAVEAPLAAPQTMTIATNHGDLTVEMDSPNAPCTAASFTYLAEGKFFDGTTCHRMVTEGIYVLQCGDPTGTGMGGPTYKYAEENLPGTESPNYPKGTVAMANTGQPSSTGSQFFIVYDNTDLPASYTIVGTVTEGLDIVEEIAADGAVDQAGETVTDGTPKTEVVIESLTVDPA